MLERSDDSIEESLAGRMFLWVLPFALRMKFRGKDAVVEGEDLTTFIEMEIRTRDGVAQRLEIAIAHRRCKIRKTSTRQPDAAMGLRLADLIRMRSGAVDGPILMAAGRMTFSGDAFLLARFPGLFGLATRSLLP
jgi:putative sterol carrier protein